MHEKALTSQARTDAIHAEGGQPACSTGYISPDPEISGRRVKFLVEVRLSRVLLRS